MQLEEKNCRRNGLKWEEKYIKTKIVMINLKLGAEELNKLLKRNPDKTENNNHFKSN